jgi:probable phosphoglycerate mutase
MTTVVLARHGETKWNREGRVQGWAATTLTERGQRQARELGSWIASRYDADRTLLSDLCRTRETAKQIQTATDSLPKPDSDRAWRERGFGVYQGFLAEHLFERHPDHDPEGSVSALAVTPTAGESIGEFCGRIETAWATLPSGTDETILLVTHGGVIKTVLSIVTPRSRTEALAESSPPNGSATVVERDGSDAQLLTVGTTPRRE